MFVLDRTADWPPQLTDVDVVVIGDLGGRTPAQVAGYVERLEKALEKSTNRKPIVRVVKRQPRALKHAEPVYSRPR